MESEKSGAAGQSGFSDGYCPVLKQYLGENRRKRKGYRQYEGF